MSDGNVVKLLQPGSFADPLTEVLLSRSPADQTRAKDRDRTAETPLFGGSGSPDEGGRVEPGPAFAGRAENF